MTAAAHAGLSPGLEFQSLQPVGRCGFVAYPLKPVEAFEFARGEVVFPAHDPAPVQTGMPKTSPLCMLVSGFTTRL